MFRALLIAPKDQSLGIFANMNPFASSSIPNFVVRESVVVDQFSIPASLIQITIASFASDSPKFSRACMISSDGVRFIVASLAM